jgi:nucleotide-binding universal stress UspA family protein
VRFIGGGLAPYCASKLAIAFNVHVPFYLAAGSVVIGACVLVTGHSLLTSAEKTPAEEMVDPSFASTPLGPFEPAAPNPVSAPARLFDAELRAPIVAAIDTGPHAEGVTDAAIELALLLDCPVEVLHIVETDVIEELAVDIETLDAARDIIDDNVNRLRSAGIAGDAHLVRVIGGHGEIGRRIAEFATECHARMIVVGPPTDGEIATAFSAGVTDQLIRYAPCPVHIVPLGSDHEPTSAGQIVG